MSASTPYAGAVQTYSTSTSVVHPRSHTTATTTAADSHCGTGKRGHIVRLIVTDTTSAGSGTCAWFEGDGSTTLMNTFNNLSGGDAIDITADVDNGFSFQLGGGAEAVVVFVPRD